MKELSDFIDLPEKKQQKIMLKVINEANQMQNETIQLANMTELEQIYCCAVRYGLGRTTYITSTISEFLIKQKLSQYCRNIMIRDIEECENFGHDCDKESWLTLLNHLKNTKPKLL